MLARQDSGKTGRWAGAQAPPAGIGAMPREKQNGGAPAACPLMTGCAGCPWAEMHAAEIKRSAGGRKGLRLRPWLLLLLAAALFAFYLAGENGPGARLMARARRLADLSLSIEKPMAVTINSAFDASATFNHSFSVPLNAEIPVRLPVKSVLRVPIFEHFQVGLDKPFAVKMEEPLHISEKIRVKADLPIDTVVEAKVLGVNTKIPIRGVVPVNFVFPLEQDIHLPESMRLTIVEPLPVEIDKVVEAPIDFVVEGSLPLRQDISVPLKEAIPCRVKIDQSLPLTINLGLSASDWGRGLRLTEGAGAQ